MPVFDDNDQDMMPKITKKIEEVQLKNRKQLKLTLTKACKYFFNQIFVKEYLYVPKYLVSHLQSW